MVKWSVHLFRTLLKKSPVEVWEPYRTDLERVAFRTLDKPRRAIGKYNLTLTTGAAKAATKVAATKRRFGRQATPLPK
jgi:hypothetical protein